MKILINVALSSLLFLQGCGGGGGVSQSASTTSTITSLNLTNVRILPTDALVNTTTKSGYAFNLISAVKNYWSRLESILIPTVYASYYPMATIDRNQVITQKIIDNNVVSLSPTFTAKDGKTINCDVSNLGLKVNSIYLLDKNNNHSVANLTVPIGLDSSCKAILETKDYFINGITGSAKLLNQSITPSLDFVYGNSIYTAGNPAFNTSSSPIITVSDIVYELQINQDGSTTLVQLTDTSGPIKTGIGQVAYDGNFLVAVAAQFNGYIVYQKGVSGFKIKRAPESYDSSVFLRDDGVFIIANGTLPKEEFNPINLTTTSWDKSLDSINTLRLAGSLHGATGRYGTWFMSSNCLIWNYSAQNFYNLYFYPDYVKTTTQDTDADGRAVLPFLGNPSFSRIDDNKAFCVNQTKNNFVRFDLDSETAVSFNLDNLGFLPTSYQVYFDKALVTATNINTSDIVIIELIFNNGQAINRGVIETSNRVVTSLVSYSNL